jgi:RHS repeat-associated protein
MKTIKPSWEISIRSLLIVVMLLGAYTPDLSVSARQDSSVTDGVQQEDLRMGLTIGQSFSSNPGNSEVPILSETIAKQAQEPREQEPIRLDLSADPAIYITNKPVIIKWELVNTDPISPTKSGIEIIARPPDGVLPKNEKDIPDTDGSLKITSPTTQGTTVWEILDYASFPLVFVYEAQQEGQVIATNTIIIDQPLATTDKTRISNIDSADQKVRLTLPANASKNPLMVDVRYPSPNSLPGTSLSWNPVEIIAVDNTTQKNVTKFDNPITIQIAYEEKDLRGWNESDLSIFYYEPEINDWFPLETTVDTRANTLTAQSDHLTVFDYKANTWQAHTTPSVDAFKTSDFTGAGTYQINMWTPPNRNGFQPSVALSYNSQIIDESHAFTQSSWVGMGWNLDLGSVTKNLYGTHDNDSDDTFSISVDGVSSQLLPISSNGNITYYNTVDQSFLKVESHDSNPNDPDSYSFIAWTKDGTRYDFKETMDVRKGPINCNNLTWRWSLTKITDVHGNVINFTYYSPDTKSDGCNSEIAVYPHTISYSNYQIEFVLETRSDYQTSWNSPDSYTLYGTRRLKEVLIKNNGAVVKKYALSYAPQNQATGNIYPNFSFSNGGRTLTLLGVQEFDGSGNALPAVTFTYGDSMHLTQVNNGQGGTVTMNYADWQYLDGVNTDIRWVGTVFQTGDCVGGAGPSPTWTQLSGNVRCDGTKLLQVGYSPAQASVGERAIPEGMIKPSAKYNFKVNVRSISGTTNVSWGIRDTVSGQSTMLSANGVNTTGGIQSQQLLTMPVTYNPSYIKLRLECAKCYFRSFDFTQYKILYRVTSRTVTTQPNGFTSTYTYQYDNASPASNDNSAAVVAAGSNLTTLYFGKLKEFRGHAMSQVTAPNGLTTATWFWQADGVKGRAYDSLVLERTFFDSLESLNANWITSGGTHTAMMEPQIDFDNSIKSVNGSVNWNASLSRASGSLTDGEMAVAHIRLSGTNAQGEVGLVNGGTFFGLTLSSSGAIASNGATVLSSTNFIKDEWYGVMLFVDANDQSRIRIWQLDNPNNSGEVTLPATPGTWTFRTRINNGTLYTDSYFEGFPYSETITKYQPVIQYDTTTGNGIPDVLGYTYKDLAITWVRLESTESRNYNGDASFVGTKQEFTYTTSYGNLLLQTESGNDGSGWSVYRKTEYEYYPNSTTYVVSAPARQLVRDANNALLAETLSFYDNASAYTTPPVKGDLTIQRIWAGGSNYAQTSLSYDSYGNPSSQTVYSDYGTATTNPNPASAQTTTTAYDTAGYNTYPISVSNPLSHTVYTSYNYALGVPTSVTDANNVTTSATYDGFGRIKTITAPGDTTPTLSITYWDSRIPYQVDLVQTVSASSSIRVSRFFDGAGREIQTQTALAVVNGTPQNIVVDTQYNNLGQTVKKTTPYIIAANAAPSFFAQSFTQPYTSFAYDVIGRILTTTSANQTSISQTYADLTTTVVDPQLNTTTTTLDVWGRTKIVSPPAGPGITYTYDVLNRLTDVDRAGNNTHIEYDILGRKVSMDDPDMGFWEYEYDALGNLTSQTDANNQTICLSYDPLNRLLGKTYSTMGGCGTPLVFDVEYGYDSGTNGIGRRTSMSEESSDATWVYDIRGRLSTESRSFLGLQDPFVTSWNYNSGDLPVIMVYPDGETITYAYNADGSLKSVTSNTNGTTYLNDMQYDEAGRVKLMEYGSNILDKTFSYFAWDTPDMGGLLSSTAVTSTASLQNLSYTYDKNGNVLTITDALFGPQTQAFTYDSLNRITSATVTGGSEGIYSETYGYDSASGNLSSKGGVTYDYADPAHAHAVTSLSNGNTYAYDANGNMIERFVDGQVFDLAYDVENRLIGVTQGSQSFVPPLNPVSLNPVGSGSYMAIPALQSGETDTPTPTPSPTSAPLPAFIPVDDAYVQSADPNTNYGSATTLQLDSDPLKNVLLKFEVSGVNGHQVTNAKLRIYNENHSNLGGDFYQVLDNSWQEETVTWNTAPVAETTLLGSLGEVSPGYWYEMDITLVITGDGTYSFMLSPASTNGADYSSKEGSNPPQLVLTLGAATPTPTPTGPTGTPVETPTPTMTPVVTDTPTATLSNTPSPTSSGPTATLTVTPESSVLPVITPLDDATIQNANPTTNYGSATTLLVDNSPIRNFLLKFEVSGINGNSVVSAKLRLYNSDGSDVGGRFYPVADNSWQEETVTWNTAPAAGTPLIDTLGTVSPGNWYEVDVTSLITEDGTYSLRVSSTSTNGADFSSKEGANPPQLIITVSGVSPTPTHTPSPTPTGSTPLPSATSTPTQTATPTQMLTPTFTLTPTQPPVTAFSSADFTYDGDGKRVKSILTTNLGSTTTFFVGTHYEVTGSTVTKYYYAGTQRIAMRKDGELFYLIGDHLGSTSIVTDDAGQVVSETRYTAWGEVRYNSGVTPTDYTYTGQYSYTADFGLMFYNARWYDPYLNHMTQPDSIVPDPHNSQDYDRYSYVRNNPLRYTDPSGHLCVDENTWGYCGDKLPAPQNVKAKDRSKYIKDVSRKYGIHLSPTDFWGYSDTKTRRLGEYDQREEAPYAFSPNGSRSDDYYNDDNEFIETPDQQVTVFLRTFEECESDNCVAGVLAHEATHSWMEWLIDNKSSLPRTDLVPVEEVLADKVALEVSPSNSIIIGKGVNEQHFSTCSAYTQSNCSNPAQTLYDYYQIEDIFSIANFVYGR